MNWPGTKVSHHRQRAEGSRMHDLTRASGLVPGRKSDCRLEQTKSRLALDVLEWSEF